jgi:hypothetical protein
MDKELAQLEEWAVNLINDYEESLRQKGITPSGTGGSEYKRIGRFSGELVANIEAYGELLDMARSQNMSGKQLVQSIRTIEDLILGQRKSVRDPVLRNMIESMSWNPADRRQLFSDVIHHLYAQRTGGDTLRRLSQPERASARGAIRNIYGRWGNVPENLLSLFRSWHTKQETAIGSEAAAIIARGGDPTKAGLQGTELVHKISPSSSKISKTVLGETAAEVLPEVLSQFEEQKVATQATMGEVSELYEDLDKIAAANAPKGRDLSYGLTMSQEDLELRRNILDANPEQVETAIKNRLSAVLDVKGGGVRLNRAALTALAAGGVAALGPLGTAASAAELAGRTQLAKETGGAVDQFQVGLAGASFAGDVVSYFPPAAPIGEAVSTAADVANIGIDVYREDPERAKRMVKQQVQRVIPSDPVVRPVQRAVQAVQRGGKLKVGFGGVKFALPELGLSELMGLN